MSIPLRKFILLSPLTTTIDYDNMVTSEVFKMPQINVKVEQKRPLDATPERALAMFNAGVKQIEIAKLWGISPGRVSHLIAKAREAKG